MRATPAVVCYSARVALLTRTPAGEVLPQAHFVVHHGRQEPSSRLACLTPGQKGGGPAPAVLQSCAAVQASSTQSLRGSAPAGPHHSGPYAASSLIQAACVLSGSITWASSAGKLRCSRPDPETPGGTSRTAAQAACAVVTGTCWPARQRRISAGCAAVQQFCETPHRALRPGPDLTPVCREGVRQAEYPGDTVRACGRWPAPDQPPQPGLLQA